MREESATDDELIVVNEPSTSTTNDDTKSDDEDVSVVFDSREQRITRGGLRFVNANVCALQSTFECL